MAKKPQPELVFGLVGPIGVNMDLLASKLCDALRQVHYEAHVINVTHLMKALPRPSDLPDTKTLYEQKIEEANAHRQAFGQSALAALAISEVKKIRQQLLALQFPNPKGRPEQINNTAFIIRQLKRPEEIELLNSVYGSKFIQVSATLDKESRTKNLIAKLHKDHPNLAKVETIANELIARDEDEDTNTFGQRVSKAFPTADVFISARDEESVSSTTLRFVEAFFGKNSISPTKDEFGAYLAKSASLRTVDLSRQVGAAIMTKSGEIIALGCNEVPRFGGGNYWFDDKGKARDIDLGTEGNKVEISRIIHDFLNRLSMKGLLKEGLSPSQIVEEHEEILDKAMVSEITEYGRMTHAEMSAICDAARVGRSLAGATLYVTTFPCHNCAKHIVAAGIDRVVFIEPYAKSRANQLHDDALSIGHSQENKVHFAHFEGISPKRFRDIFEKGKRRKSDGTIRVWYKDDHPSPMVREIDPLHVQREPYAISAVLQAMGNQLSQP